MIATAHVTACFANVCASYACIRLLTLVSCCASLLCLAIGTFSPSHGTGMAPAVALLLILLLFGGGMVASGVYDNSSALHELFFFNMFSLVQ